MKPMKLILVGLLPFAAVASPSYAEDAKLSIEKPWARASIGTSRPTAAFLTIVNRASAPDRLLGVSSPAAARVEVHRTEIKDGSATMMKVEGVVVPAGGTVEFKPGSYHIMLMKLTAQVTKGTRLPLTLTFERAGRIAVEAKVMGPGSSGPGHRH